MLTSFFGTDFTVNLLGPSFDPSQLAQLSSRGGHYDRGIVATDACGFLGCLHHLDRLERLSHSLLFFERFLIDLELFMAVELEQFPRDADLIIWPLVGEVECWVAQFTLEHLTAPEGGLRERLTVLLLDSGQI